MKEKIINYIETLEAKALNYPVSWAKAFLDRVYAKGKQIIIEEK